MKKVYIQQTQNADTRSLKKLDYDLVLIDTKNHILGVQKVMHELAQQLQYIGKIHDHTKTYCFEEFFKAISTGKTGAEFFKLDWWKLHLTERHHLKQSAPKDVNLLDVLEMIVDCICAGKARTGYAYPYETLNLLTLMGFDYENIRRKGTKLLPKHDHYYHLIINEYDSGIDKWNEYLIKNKEKPLSLK